ncbi:MAG TPA: hypothetical protein VIU12_12680 [Chryseolinea sp.]
MDKEIERQIDEISSSAIEFRKSIDRIAFGRLKTFFKSKEKEISRDSKLEDLLGRQCTPNDWYELDDIGLKVPELTRHKAFNYVIAAYVLLAVITWSVIFLTNLEKVPLLWGLPMGVMTSVAFTLTLSPILGIMAIFKKRFLPVDNIDELVDGIIAENWVDLLADDKRLFKEILRQELVGEQRANA